jgi:tRNA A-37 threonylcarbamoyl transferase component Bud32
MNLNKIRNFTKSLKPNWPLPVKYIGGGANGRVFETDNGRYIKYVLNWSPQEWQALKKLQGNFRFPRIKNGNHLNIKITNANRQNIANIFNIKKLTNVGRGMTVFIMGKVGGGHAMTLHAYLRKFPDANRARVQNRVLSLIDYMHSKGVSHGNLHSLNILVTADAKGRLTGMWVIDFGRSRNIPLGKSEQNVFSKLKLTEKFETPNINGKTVAKINVRNGSRMNRHMASGHYKKSYTQQRTNTVAKKRLEINKEMKSYKSPKKIVKPVRKTRSLNLKNVRGNWASKKLEERRKTIRWLHYVPRPASPRVSPKRPSSKSVS